MFIVVEYLFSFLWFTWFFEIMKNWIKCSPCIMDAKHFVDVHFIRLTTFHSIFILECLNSSSCFGWLRTTRCLWSTCMVQSIKTREMEYVCIIAAKNFHFFTLNFIFKAYWQSSKILPYPKFWLSIFLWKLSYDTLVRPLRVDWLTDSSNSILNEDLCYFFCILQFQKSSEGVDFSVSVVDTFSSLNQVKYSIWSHVH